MNIKSAVYYLIFLFISISAGFHDSCAQEIPVKPDPPRLVNDFAGILTDRQAAHLERKLVAFNDTTSNQIVIVIVNSLGGMGIAEFADRLGEDWGVGQEEFDNGAVVLVKPKTANSRGKVHIATGYGLEGAIPDAIAKRIVENELIPNFKTENYFAGLNRATDILMSLAVGEYKEEYAEEKRSPGLYLLPFFIILGIYFLVMRNMRRTKTFGKNVPFWTALWLGSTMTRGSGRSWGSRSSGSFGGGGFGGGSSFGGFGGGGFGGGGAGGSW